MGGRSGWYFRLLLVLALVAAALPTVTSGPAEARAPTPPPLPEPALGFVNLLFSGPGTTARYGANQIVRIEIGNINFIRGCVPGPSRGGFPDFLQPAADLYIVDAGRTFTNTTPLVDVAGEANTAIGGTAGAFFNLPLGLTKPAGRIPSGTYDVVVDECQNGMYDTGQDTVVRDAFSVDVDEIVPGFDTDAAEWNNLKRVAKAQLGGGITDLEKLYVQIVAAELFDQLNGFGGALISPTAFAGFAVSYWIGQNDPFAKARAKGKEFIRATATSRRRAVGNLAGRSAGSCVPAVRDSDALRSGPAGRYRRPREPPGRG